MLIGGIFCIKIYFNKNRKFDNSPDVKKFSVSLAHIKRISVIILLESTASLKILLFLSSADEQCTTVKALHDSKTKKAVRRWRTPDR